MDFKAMYAAIEALEDAKRMCISKHAKQSIASSISKLYADMRDEFIKRNGESERISKSNKVVRYAIYAKQIEAACCTKEIAEYSEGGVTVMQMLNNKLCYYGFSSSFEASWKNYQCKAEHKISETQICFSRLTGFSIIGTKNAVDRAMKLLGLRLATPINPEYGWRSNDAIDIKMLKKGQRVLLSQEASAMSLDDAQNQGFLFPNDGKPHSYDELVRKAWSRGFIMYGDCVCKLPVNAMLVVSADCKKDDVAKVNVCGQIKGLPLRFVRGYVQNEMFASKSVYF